MVCQQSKGAGNTSRWEGDPILPAADGPEQAGHGCSTAELTATDGTVGGKGPDKHTVTTWKLLGLSPIAAFHQLQGSMFDECFPIESFLGCLITP